MDLASKLDLLPQRGTPESWMLERNYPRGFRQWVRLQRRQY
jgi:hypothetical protein